MEDQNSCFGLCQNCYFSPAPRLTPRGTLIKCVAATTGAHSQPTVTVCSDQPLLRGQTGFFCPYSEETWTVL